MITNTERVPMAMSERFAAITALTDAFCADKLNDEYAQLIQFAAAALCRKRPSPAASGAPAGWAAGITHAIGTVNFLFDPAMTPHVTAPALYQGFGVSASNGQGKSKRVRDMLRMHPFDPDWTRPSRQAGNPMAWMLRIDGLVVDARRLPRKEQVLLHKAGFIPFVHADLPSPHA
ncbi:MAG: DUF6398 domain-containing protein [Thiohalocapsa sp.]